MLRVRDVMTPQVFALDAEASTEEAAWALSRRHIGGAPVRDGDGNFIGIISLSDLVNPEPNDWIRGEGTVQDRMSPVIYSIYADDPALAAAELMQLRDVHRLLVFDADGKPAGIVTSKNISDAVAERRDFAITRD
jgi:predicted transcriptional regulator